MTKSNRFRAIHTLQFVFICTAMLVLTGCRGAQLVTVDIVNKDGVMIANSWWPTVSAQEPLEKICHRIDGETSFTLEAEGAKVLPAHQWRNDSVELHGRVDSLTLKGPVRIKVQSMHSGEIAFSLDQVVLVAIPDGADQGELSSSWRLSRQTAEALQDQVRKSPEFERAP